LPLVYRGALNTSNGLIYQVKGNSSGELGLPADLLVLMNNGISWRNIFPYKESIYSIALDQQNRLYVGVNNTVMWEESKGYFDEHLENNAAFYYSKK